MRRTSPRFMVPIVLGFLVSFSAWSRGDYTFSTIVNFNGTNGSEARGGLTLDSSGNLYGTTVEGGTNNSGLVYKIAAGTGTISTVATLGGSLGSYPGASVTLDSQGNIYGTTEQGGAYGAGSVFEVAAGTNSASTIASFHGSNGASLYGSLTMDSSGNLYGTTANGGAYGHGTVFEISGTTGTLSTLASFNGTVGSNPFGSLTIDAQGNIYGTTTQGGTNALGTVFKIDAGTGVLSSIYSFSTASGNSPVAGLTLDSQGNLYGAVGDGGTDNHGAVFMIAAGTGAFSTVASFTGTNGGFPTSNLIIDAQGNIFGTTNSGGSSNDGTVFEIPATTGNIATLYNFNGTNGLQPYAGLTMDAQGDLFGTTESGGTNGKGTVFELINNPATVPEPASIVALGQAATLVGLALIARSRRRRKA